MSRFKPRSFKAGDVIFREGDGSGPAYLIKRGRAEVTIGMDLNEKTVATIGENSIFGEMSLMDGSPRSATVTALEDMECFIIDRRRFEGLFDDAHPIARTLFEVQCSRLRKATQQLGTDDPI